MYPYTHQVLEVVLNVSDFRKAQARSNGTFFPHLFFLFSPLFRLLNVLEGSSPPPSLSLSLSRTQGPGEKSTY